MKRDKALDKVKQIICNDRQDVHGAPENTHELIASFWWRYLHHTRGFSGDLDEQDVAVMMCLFKIARHAMNQKHEDNLLDLIGYAAIAVELGE